MSVLVLVGGLVLWALVVKFFVLNDPAPHHHYLPGPNDFDGGY